MALENANTQGLVLFSQIEKLGSLSAAAQLLGISRSSVSKQLAALEMILSEGKGEDFDINQVIKQYTLDNMDEVNAVKKGLYVEFTGEIICRLDS